MPTVRPSGAGDEAVGNGEVRDGGTVLKGGSNAAGVMTKSLSLADVADDVGQAFGSKVVANDGTGSEFTDKVGVGKAQSGGTIAYNADGTEWVVKGGNVTTTLGGVANTTLIGGQAGPDPVRDNIAQLETTRDYGVLDLDVLAAPASGLNSFRTITGGGVEKNYIDPAVAGGATNSNDSAANTTRAIPGEFVYRNGSANPIQDNFKSKEAPES
tara:strand:+ start:2061 stop:2699 length:639 start_codon:yes stop_codon:yes gene_type:complete